MHDSICKTFKKQLYWCIIHRFIHLKYTAEWFSVHSQSCVAILNFFLLFKLRYNPHTVKFTLYSQYTIQFLVYSQLCNHHRDLIPEHFHYPLKKSHTQQQLPPTQPLATTNLFSVSMDLPILDILYKGNHIICCLL